MRTMDTEDQAEQAPAAEPRKSTSMRIEGNKLVCNCHDRVILTFNPATLAEYRRKHPDE